MGADAVGWTASAILLATLVRQVIKQARDADAAGVSHWLFLGQSAASVGFIVYSVLVDNWVFIVTNTCILATAIVGQVITWRRQRG
jgi:MtN3 and saliva related transmembrane protein